MFLSHNELGIAMIIMAFGLWRFSTKASRVLKNNPRLASGVRTGVFGLINRILK